MKKILLVLAILGVIMGLIMAPLFLCSLLPVSPYEEAQKLIQAHYDLAAVAIHGVGWCCLAMDHGIEPQNISCKYQLFHLWRDPSKNMAVAYGLLTVRVDGVGKDGKPAEVIDARMVLVGFTLNDKDIVLDRYLFTINFEIKNGITKSIEG